MTPDEKKILRALHAAVRTIVEEERNQAESYILDLRKRIVSAESHTDRLEERIKTLEEVLRSKLWALVKELVAKEPKV